MLKTCLENVRSGRPLIHSITNYVTVNDCANILLACGGSPIMADAPEEVEEITALCGGLCLNIGTLSAQTIPSMFLAGKRAGALGRPVVLDPVGAGASALRTDTALRLLREVPVTAVRGNISELRALSIGTGSARGVDADAADAVTEDRLETAVNCIRAFARDVGAVVVVTGAIDLVSDGERMYVIRNGRPEMGGVTGTGCQLSAMLTAYLAANPGNTLEAAAAAVCAMGLAGEVGWARLGPGEGNAAYRGHIIDAVYHLTGDALEQGARYEIR